MSVMEVVARLQRAHALIKDARRAAAVADEAITDGAHLFAAATAGSGQPCVEAARHHTTAAGTEVRTAHALFEQAQTLIDVYCHAVAGHGIAGGAAPSVASRSEEPTAPLPTSTSHPTENPEVCYAAQITELLRAGKKITPSEVIRVGRHREDILSGSKRGYGTVRARHIYSDPNGRTASKIWECLRTTSSTSSSI
ncbi:MULTISPECIES: hypothetical protein [Actinoalloteichus]|uniref:Uncharacterized protein n=1 Tax=Actinoalloteichus fjordicus TaxID=1612552 RepID=A0AAC9LHZ7_9PSEU|nr:MULTISPECIES: hypothetical protein [Actinoalloteichus]APU17922.1 hypothetical protein UA74_29650 [Actinoalloteichus fjordicus]APU24000.1 hypothetical protein UA75_30180 [Actinoalloteichus sp. GBA129-24]